MTKDAPYDLIVIGGGSGGLTAAIMAGRLGARVLLVDRERLGGDCLYAGCVPSKALIASAKLAHQMRRAPEFGIGAVPVEVDFPAVMQRIERIQAQIAETESPQALEKHGVEVAFGGACFVDENSIRIGENRTESAKSFVIATGSRAVPLPIPGLAETGAIDHVGLFEMQALPARTVVIGGGPIGCEMGQALSRLGSHVTIVDRGDRLLHREDPEVSGYLTEVLEDEGIELVFSANVTRVEKRGAAKFVHLDAAGLSIEIECDEILVAIGRRPNLELDLENAGVRFETRGIEVNDALQTSQKHIYAVGDCAGGPQFTHWAEHEARVATRNALFLGNTRRSTERIPWVTFTDPEVARVGQTLEQAKREHPEAHEHRVPFTHVDRAVCEGDAGGFAKVVVNGQDRLLGVHIIGQDAGEVLTEWVLAMDHGLKLQDVGNSIHVYPTLCRANRRLADERFFEHGVSPWTTKLFGKFRPS